MASSAGVSPRTRSTPRTRPRRRRTDDIENVETESARTPFPILGTEVSAWLEDAGWPGNAEVMACEKAADHLSVLAASGELSRPQDYRNWQAGKHRASAVQSVLLILRDDLERFSRYNEAVLRGGWNGFVLDKGSPLMDLRSLSETIAFLEENIRRIDLTRPEPEWRFWARHIRKSASSVWNITERPPRSVLDGSPMNRFVQLALARLEGFERPAGSIEDALRDRGRERRRRVAPMESERDHVAPLRTAGSRSRRRKERPPCSRTEWP